jgi:RimJ/RimL family protein N-acetyltransferase
MKRLMLDHAFASFPDVWLHIGTDNLRSQRATEKIGAVYVRTEPMDIVGSDGEMMCYRLSRADWQARRGK